MNDKQTLFSAVQWIFNAAIKCFFNHSLTIHTVKLFYQPFLLLKCIGVYIEYLEGNWGEKCLFQFCFHR